MRKGFHVRFVALLVAAICAFTVLMPVTPAEAQRPGTPVRGQAGDRLPLSSRLDTQYDVRGSTGSRTDATLQAAAPGFTFTFNSPVYPWTPAELALLQSWTAPGSPQMTALSQVVGAPNTGVTINISHDPTIPAAGYYDPSTGALTLHDAIMSVLLHELNHAVHGSFILGYSTWEEGMARAAEMREMGLLAAQGIVEDFYQYNHSADYDTYYENSNSPLIGLKDGSIWGYGDFALPLLRYEQSGYAFGKILIENPNAIKAFNALLFQHPNEWLSQTTLISMMSSVQPFVEGTPTATWFNQQRIFDIAPAQGCSLLQRPSQFTVDFYCRDANGQEVVQAGATVRLNIYDVNNQLVFSGQDVTTSYGFASFSPELSFSYRRLRMVASVVSGPPAPSSTYYRSDTPWDSSTLGVFGVVTNVVSGNVTFTSPDGQFATFSVPVSQGAFSAPTLRSIRGPVEATFSGGGLTATRRFNKDASQYSVVMTGATPKCSYPGAPTHGVATSGALTTGSAPTVPLVTTWTAASGSGCYYELQRQSDSGAWTTLYIGSARSYAWRSAPGLISAFRVRAKDAAGSPSTWAMTVMSTLDGFQETNATYAGTFTNKSNTADWGGAVKASTAAGASATLTFSGRSVAVLGRKASTEGAFKVYVDGVLISTPTEYVSGSTTYRQIVAQWAGAAGSHTLRVVNVGTAGHPSMNVDGFAVVR